MTTQTEALKLALEGAANYIDTLGGDSRKYRQALAQPEQPDLDAICQDLQEKTYNQAMRIAELEAQLKPLTDEQIDAAIRNSKKVDTGYAGWVRDQRKEFARAIEAAHNIKEKNT